jgi:hypothetical protein
MNEYPHNRGADLAAACEWSNSDGTPKSLAGITFTAFEVVPATLQANVTFTITDSINGRFTVNLPWSSLWPPNEGAVVHIGVKSSDGEAFDFDLVLI